MIPFFPVPVGVPIKDGTLTTIEILRRREEELGISIVGGNETPLVSGEERPLLGDMVLYINLLTRLVPSLKF